MKIETASFVRSATRRDQFPRDGLAAVAFVGRSNVGKSSVMNRLLGRKGLARTSSTPGRTQMVNYFVVNRRFYFVDLPGYGYAKAAKRARKEWAALMDQYFRHTTPKPLLVHLVDGKVGATALDQQAHAYVESLGYRSLIVATKIDKVPRSRRDRALAAIRADLALAPERELLAFSAWSGEGVKQLWSALGAFLGNHARMQQQRTEAT